MPPICFKCTGLFSETDVLSVAQFHDPPNVCLSESGGIVPMWLIFRWGHLAPDWTLCSSGELLPCSQFSYRVSPEWGLLTQRNLRPWWIAALQTTTKSGLCWSVVALRSRQRDQPVRACLVGNSVCTVCCVYGSVCCPVDVSLCTPQVWCHVFSQEVVFTEWLTG